MSDRRLMANRRQKESEKMDLRDARVALIRFRKNNDPSGFPELRSYLWKKSIGFPYRRLGLDGFGHHDEWRLTEDEYEKFKGAFKVTEAGAKDDWDIGGW